MPPKKAPKKTKSQMQKSAAGSRQGSAEQVGSNLASQKSESRYIEPADEEQAVPILQQEEAKLPDPDEAQEQVEENQVLDPEEQPMEEQIEQQQDEVEQVQQPESQAQEAEPAENEQDFQQIEVDNAEQIMDDILNEQQPAQAPQYEEIHNELEDQDPDFDGSLQKGETIDTKGMTLGANLDDIVNKSVAMTEMIKPQNDQNALIDNNENFEKFTDINQDQVKQKEDQFNIDDHLGFMDDDLEIAPTELSQNIKLVKDSWAKFEKLGLDKCGQAFFRNIFKIAPTAILLFPFQNEPKIYQSEAFKAHSLKAIQAVDMAVKSLDDLEQLLPKLKALGKLHVGKGVKAQHYPVVGQALITTLSAGLKKSWNERTEKAWEAIFQIIQDTMISDHYEFDDPNDIELTDERLQLVQKTWKQIVVSELMYEPVGLAILKEFFQIQPDALSLFSFKNETDRNFEELYDNDLVKNHARMIIQTFDTAISQLHDFQSIEDTLKQLGKSHFTRDVTESHYEGLAQAILAVLEEALEQDWSNKVNKAWVCAWTKMSNTMKGDHYPKMTFPNANDDTEALNQTERIDDSMRGLIQGEDVQSIEPLRKKSADNKKNQGKEEDDEIRKHYLKRFRAEVDFHHKVAYRFEKAYRLGKKTVEKKQSLNLDIIDCISEHSGYIEQDPMALFYCLFFCIYYRNEELVEFLRTLINKIFKHEKIDKLLEYIDVNGIERIRTVGEQINSIVYHMVFYQAVDDDLRIVYSQIFRQLRFIQLRDKDALQLLNQRDYELIRLSFNKYTTKLNLTLFFPKAFTMKSSTYRRYNQAYFEEVVINNDVEQRVAQNYRERFLITAEDIYIVFQMYCKEDYDEQFMKTKKDEITHQQFVELFIICVKNDSFKIGMIIYLLFLQPSVDIDQAMLNIIMTSLKESVYFHEIKLFFIHEHFDELSIGQLNSLVDIYQDILHHKDPKLNPMVNQFNTIKISMLIYRICFKIEEKKIYSLITKCSLLKNYLISSLVSYFEKQNNILVLYKLMSEPILHMTEKKDSLDIMYEMNMQELLRNPVVVEVLNLVYEGKYSISASALSMSQTFFCLLEMDTADIKSIYERLTQNIINLGDSGSAKQTSLQYHIWKQSIQQRESDEMFFVCLINFIMIGLAVFINSILNSSNKYIKDYFGGHFGKRVHLIQNADQEKLKSFCEGEIGHVVDEYKAVKLFYNVIIITCIGMIASIIQKLVQYKYRNNVTLNFSQIGLELSIFVSSILFIVMFNNRNYNTLISDLCSPFVEMDAQTIDDVDHMYTMRNPRETEGELSFRLIISVIIVQAVLFSVMMLQRTEYLGELIMMLTQMNAELLKFFLTFGMIILLFVFIGRFLSSEIKYQSSNFYEIILDLFQAFVGNQDFEQFTIPTGQIYIGTFMYLFKVLFLSLLAAMFINKYKVVWRNLDAYKRFNIIKAKNSISYDKFIGGCTLTFFPFNILMMPLIPPIVALRNKRASDFLLKMQYVLMMIMYSVIAGAAIVPFTPILYIKSIANSLYIVVSQSREDYPGQKIVHLLMSIFLGPLVISLSLVIDLLTLPNILLRDSKDFEHKYQLSTDRLNDAQIEVVMVTFGKIFYGTNFQKFKGSHMTLIELMNMHTGIFKITENLHMLFCIGSKDSKEALSNVQDYNMTKILTRKCSIPDKSGEFKQARCELDVIHAVQMDIEMFNYVDVLHRKFFMGKLAAEVAMKSNGKANLAEENGAQDAAAVAVDEDDDDDETKKIDGIFKILIGPDGVPLKRNNSDVVNNFYINYVVRSYTNIDQTLNEIRQNSNRARESKMSNLIERQKDEWKTSTEGNFKHYSDKFSLVVNRQFGIKEQLTQGSTKSSNENPQDKDKEGSTTDSKDKSPKGKKKSAHGQKKTQKNLSKSKKKAKGEKLSKSMTSK